MQDNVISSRLCCRHKFCWDLTILTKQYTFLNLFFAGGEGWGKGWNQITVHLLPKAVSCTEHKANECFFIQICKEDSPVKRENVCHSTELNKASVLPILSFKVRWLKFPLLSWTRCGCHYHTYMHICTFWSCIQNCMKQPGVPWARNPAAFIPPALDEALGPDSATKSFASAKTNWGTNRLQRWEFGS